MYNNNYVNFINVSCRYLLSDANFLLRFLRTKKFSVPMAQEAIERYILLRQSWGIAFNQLDHTLPVMTELIDLG